MSVVIKPKRTATQSRVPTTSDLEDGEMAVNITDRKVYVGNGNQVVKVAEVGGATGGGFIDEGTAIAFAIALGG